MRVIENAQLQIGQQDIAKIRLDPKSRDDIPQVLRGLKHIYTTPEIRNKVFQILEQMIPQKINIHNGRPGMPLWKILVLGVLRLNLNHDYDRIHELANNHKTLRQMLGHGLFDDDLEYKLQTLKDNVSLLTPEILDRINEVVVASGHLLVKKKGERLEGRCDSFVLETDIHYPTDISLLLDAIRKIILLTSRLCGKMGLSAWRQSGFNLRKVKRLYRKLQKMKRSNSKDDKKKKERDALIRAAHQIYLSIVGAYIDKAEASLEALGGEDPIIEAAANEIRGYIAHGRRQIDQIERRVLKGETIPHDEKVFSIFEEHTEWISKGKAGVPVEFGLKVCILEDQHGFILHHRVMENETDAQVAVTMVKEAKKRHECLTQCSFDKGFHSPANQESLCGILDPVILPRKGKLSEAIKAQEQTGAFIRGRCQHSAVESAINALEVHGLDRCPDHGIEGFKRYVSLA